MNVIWSTYEINFEMESSYILHSFSIHILHKIDMVVAARALAELRLVTVFALIPPPTHPPPPTLT